MDYPPPRHMLRDLRLEIARAGERVEVSGPGPGETRSRGGGVSAGVLGVAVDVLGGNLALRTVQPDWCVTSTLSLHLLRPVEGGFRVTGAPLRAGRTQIVLDVKVWGEGESSKPAAVAAMAFTRIARREDTLEWVDTGDARTVFAGPDSGLAKPFAEQLGCRVVDAAAGVVELPVTDYVKNSVGALQGGAVIALVDAAAEAVAGARMSDPVVTRDVAVHYLALGRAGPIRTRTHWLSGDERRARLRVELVDAGQDDRLLSVADVGLGPL